MSESLLEPAAAPDAAAAPAEPEGSQAQGAALLGQNRPEWLPEKYQTGEDLAKAYKALESKLGAKDEELRETITTELTEARFKDRPETVGEYSLGGDVDASSELVGWWAQTAFDNGLSQDQFAEGIEFYRSNMTAAAPDLEAESKLLGENASERIDAASAFANKFFPEEALGAIERMCEGHDGIIALEAIMNATKGTSFSGEGQPSGATTEAELHEMMRDPRYHSARDRDPDYVKKVNDGFDRLFG